MNSAWVAYLPVFLRRRLEQRYGLQRALGNTLWLFMDRIARLVAGLVVGIAVARYLGPSDFGLLNYAISFAALFAAISGLGLEGVLLRELVRTPGEKDELLGSAFWLRVISGSLVWGLITLIGAIVFRDEHLVFWLVVVIAGGFIFQAFDVVESYFASTVASKYAVMAKGITFVIFAATRLLLVVFQAPLLWFAAAVAGEVIAGGIGLAILYRRKSGLVTRWRFGFARSKLLVRECWPYLAAALAVTVYIRIDQIMLNHLASAHEAGIFIAAVRVSELWYFVPLAIVQSVVPSLVNAREQSQSLYQSHLQLLYDGLIWMAIMIGAVMTLFADEIAGLLYGPAYMGAGAILMIHAWTGVFAAYGAIKGRWEMIENMPKMSLYCTSAGAVTNIVANYLLIPKYGGIGAAAATLIAQTVSGLLLPLAHPVNRLAVINFVRALVPQHLFVMATKGVRL